MILKEFTFKLNLKTNEKNYKFCKTFTEEWKKDH